MLQLLPPLPLNQPNPTTPPHLQVLARANHSAEDMLRSVGSATDAAVASGDMASEVAERLMATYTSRMHGYT